MLLFSADALINATHYMIRWDLTVAQHYFSEALADFPTPRPIEVPLPSSDMGPLGQLRNHGPSLTHCPVEKNHTKGV